MKPNLPQCLSLPDPTPAISCSSLSVSPWSISAAGACRAPGSRGAESDSRIVLVRKVVVRGCSTRDARRRRQPRCSSQCGRALPLFPPPSRRGRLHDPRGRRPAGVGVGGALCACGDGASGDAIPDGPRAELAAGGASSSTSSSVLARAAGSRRSPSRRGRGACGRPSRRVADPRRQTRREWPSTPPSAAGGDLVEATSWPSTTLRVASQPRRAARTLGCSPFICRGRSTARPVDSAPLRRATPDAPGPRPPGHRAHDLTALALDLGYADHSHFTNAFREEWGLPPSRFRELHRPAADRGTEQHPSSRARVRGLDSNHRGGGTRE